MKLTSHLLFSLGTAALIFVSMPSCADDDAATDGADGADGTDGTDGDTDGTSGDDDVSDGDVDSGDTTGGDTAGGELCDALTVCGEIEYAGSKTGSSISIVLHDSEPPMGPPLGLLTIPDPVFPVSFSKEVPRAATYYYRIFLDVDGAGGGYPDDAVDPQNDPETSPGSVVPETGGAEPVVLTLVDPE